jgi:hypothetical protein
VLPGATYHSCRSAFASLSRCLWCNWCATMNDVMMMMCWAAGHEQDQRHEPVMSDRAMDFVNATSDTQRQKRKRYDTIMNYLCCPPFIHWVR